MSLRPQFTPFKAINAQPMAANITGSVTVCQQAVDISYSLSWSGTAPVGTFAIQVCNDYVVGAAGGGSGGNWVSLPLTLNNGVNTSTVTAIPISGNSDVGMVEAKIGAGYAVRPIYTASSGVGTLTVTGMAKVE